VRRPSLLLLGLVLALAACSGPSPAARVDGITITDEELAHVTDLFRFAAAVTQQPCGQLDPASGEPAEAACTRYALGNLIEFAVVRDWAAEHGVAVADPDVDDVVQGLEDRLGAQALDRQLAAHELTRADVRELARDLLLVRAVALAVAEDELGEKGIRDRYEDRIADHTIVRVDHILVRTRSEARDVYEKVTAPGATRATFLALARSVSIDPTAAENSGSLGSTVASTYVPAFAEAALDLEPGEISPPVRTEFGWHVIRLEAKQVQPLARVRESILQQAAQEVFPAWLRDRLAEGLEVNPRYGRFDLEALTVVRISSTDPSATATPSGAIASP
jgi:foldase protein PrsA